MWKIKTCTLAVAVALALPAQAADDRQSMELLRQTTLDLIDALVETGVLTRAKADALIKQAEAKAADKVAKAAADPARPATVRVPYIPESVRNDIRDQVKQEVLAQARNERWAAPNSLPEWVSRIQWEGDVRVRYQSDMFADDNTPAAYYAGANMAAIDRNGRPSIADGSSPPYVTRNAAATETDSEGRALGSLNEDQQRWRVRARLGLTAQVADTVSAGVRLATGNTNDRVSTNQTLGQNFNKYSFVVDRAFIRYDPVEWLTVSGGRIANPWLSTDLIWDEDLNFEGLAATLKPSLDSGRLRPFLTAGWFPLRIDAPKEHGSRSLSAVQVGVDWEARRDLRLKFGAAQYKFDNVEGREDRRFDEFMLQRLPGYGQYEYGSGFRSKGNTLFTTNNRLEQPGNPFDSSNWIWGLASRFEPLALTAAIDIARFDPVHVMLSAEYIKNTAFDRKEIQRRTGVRLSDGSDTAYLYRIAVGMPSIRQLGDWQASLTYRRVGSDAVLDAFTDSDFGLGGTNVKGYTLGFSYGIEQNTAIGLRWMSADSIDSPTLVSGDKFGVDTLQMDLSVRF
ncbi:putative porin [Thauera sinica]|uniref:Porin n=1 Tax=Thauera sinica TaxID=2665146 RepID=A0ABW1ANF7_9RHOO|nr:putative porin [Thauera sp. K11]ATE60501.1 hypothetical protein CCZ27_11575 [Thauera sp. K11]